MQKIAEKIMDFKSFEKEVFAIVCEFGRALMAGYVKEADRIVMATRDTKEYRLVNFGSTTIKTVMGEVPYERRRYKKLEGGYTFLLDEVMGIEDGCGLVSENLAEQIVIECSEKSFRKAAESISSLTGQSISAMGAWGVLQQFGEKLESKEDRLGELDQAGVTGQLGNISSKVLFEELDDVWISMQKEQRRKKGEQAKAGEKKTGKKPIHVGTAYTGWEQSENGKLSIIDKIGYAGFGDSKEFVSDFEILLRQRFDMDGVERRLMNGDGASWIKSAADEIDAFLQLDPFHRSRAVMRGVSDKKDQSTLFNAIREKDVNKVLTTIDAFVAKETDESSRNKLEKLRGYFYGNIDSLLTWQERGIELPEPPDGVVFRSMGIQESSNCDLITQRMKHRKGSWSYTGGEHMAKILCFRYTIGLDAILGTIPEPVEVELPTDALSAAKAPIFDGKGYAAEWMHADMPFEQAFKTNGREAIRGLLRQRSLV
jgi:hypothetical protein